MRPIWKAADLVDTLWAGWLGRHALALIIALALALRLALIAVPAFHHPDEIFQYLEPAHRLVTGYGIVTWEWREGIRGWFLPVLLAGPMAISDWLWPGSAAYLPIIRGLLALASLSIVLSAYAIGNAISRFHGLVAAFVAAVWFELVYFSGHTLSEPISYALLLPAAAILWRAETASRKALVVAGFLLGIAVVIRFQHLPAIAILVALTCKVRFREVWLPVAIGGALALALGGVVDLAFGVAPYSWAFRNFATNALEGRSEAFGVSNPLYYPGFALIYLWQSASIPIVALAAVAVRRYPALFVAALVNILVHSLIGHKEYRFILMSTSIVVLFFSLGLADVLEYIGGRNARRQRTVLVAGALVWVVALSVSLSAGERFRYEWMSRRPSLLAMQSVNRIEALCGLGLVQMRFFDSGGYTYLDRRIPIHWFEKPHDIPAAVRASAAFNVVIAPREAGRSLPADYALAACFDPADPLGVDPKSPATCVYRRAGSCAPAGPEINRTLSDKGH